MSVSPTKPKGKQIKELSSVVRSIEKEKSGSRKRRNLRSGSSRQNTTL